MASTEILPNPIFQQPPHTPRASAAGSPLGQAQSSQPPPPRTQHNATTLREPPYMGRWKERLLAITAYCVGFAMGFGAVGGGVALVWKGIRDRVNEGIDADVDGTATASGNVRADINGGEAEISEIDAGVNLPSTNEPSGENTFFGGFLEDLQVEDLPIQGGGKVTFTDGDIQLSEGNGPLDVNADADVSAELGPVPTAVWAPIAVLAGIAVGAVTTLLARQHFQLEETRKERDIMANDNNDMKNDMNEIKNTLFDMRARLLPPLDLSASMHSAQSHLGD